MERQDFINGLRRGLSGMEDYEYVNETVNYYENYIDSEIRKGETEESVLRMLGDPGLIAKSIRASRGEVGTSAGTTTATFEEVERGADNNNNRSLWQRFFSLPPWAIKTTIVAVVVIALMLFGMLLTWLFPVLVVGGVAYVFYKFVKDNFFK